MNPAASPCLIFNPSAQGGRAGRFRSHPGLPAGQCVFLATSAPGDARRLAAQAVRDGFQTIIAAGGDGTVNEVLNGIADVPGGLRAVRLGILPLGTVNVFARELGLPLNLRRAWKVLALARERTIDLGRAQFTLDGLPRRRCFVQLAGAGLDSRAIELTSWSVKKKIGPLAYFLAGLKALSESRPLVTVQAGETLAGEWVAVGNGRFTAAPFPSFPAPAWTTACSIFVSFPTPASSAWRRPWPACASDGCTNSAAPASSPPPPSPSPAPSPSSSNWTAKTSANSPPPSPSNQEPCASSCRDPGMQNGKCKMQNNGSSSPATGSIPIHV